MGVEGSLDVDACAAYLVAALEGADSVEDCFNADAEGFGCGSFVVCDGCHGMALGCGGDECEFFGDPGDPSALGELGVVDAACETVEVSFVAA